MANKIKKIVIILLDIIILIYSIFFAGCFITNYSFILKNSISNLSIVGGFFILLLSVYYFSDKKSFYNSVFMKFLRYLSGFNDKVILIIIFAVFMLIFVPIGVLRHYAFSTGMDLGIVDQAVWNTIYEGNILFTSLSGNINYLGSHFSLILLLIAPFYLIGQGTIILIFLQAAVIGVSIFPLYLITKYLLKSRVLIFVFIFAFFLSKPLRGVGFLDFHADVFLIPLGFISYYFLVTKRTFWAVVSITLMLCCKESAAILVFAYGIFTITYLRRYYLGASFVVLAIGWWVIVTNLIMPKLAYTSTYPYSHWFPFGTTYADNLSAVIKNPSLPIKLFFSSKTIDYCVKLFVPLGLLSFLSPQHYVLFMVPLVFNIMGSIHHGGMITITSHYPAQILPFIFISAIYGAGKLMKLLTPKMQMKRAQILIGVIIIVLSLAFFGKSDGHKLSKFMSTVNTLHSSEIRQALKQIPLGASVCAVHRIAPHLAHRKYIYFWEDPPAVNTRYLVEYVVLHKKLIEEDKDNFDQNIIELKKKGFKEIYSDKYKELFIFFNPMNKKEDLKNIQSKILL